MKHFHSVVVLVALCSVGCTRGTTTPANILIYGRGGDADQLDPIHTDVGETVKVIVNIFDTLVNYHDETLEIVPSLATEWESSEDGLTWTFKLRKGVKFHDGTDFNADAVVFSFQRMLDANPGGEGGQCRVVAR